MSGAILLLPQYTFMAWCLVKHRDIFYVTILHVVITLNFNLFTKNILKKIICIM